MELNVESIPIIKNIIKNQKKFNYDSLPNISHFVDICDLYQITPLEFYCRKKNKSKIIEILEIMRKKVYEHESLKPEKDPETKYKEKLKQYRRKHKENLDQLLVNF